MLLTLGISNSRVGSTTREHMQPYPDGCHSDTNVFRRLDQSLRGPGSVTPTAHLNARARTLADEYAVTAAVDKLAQYRTKIGAASIEGPYNYSRSALFPCDRSLRMKYLADGLVLRKILWADESCFTLQGMLTSRSRVWARDSSRAIRERGYHVGFSVSF
jgi:hypothetical protein